MSQSCRIIGCPLGARHYVACRFCGDTGNLDFTNIIGKPNGEPDIRDLGIFHHGKYRYTCYNDAIHRGVAFLCDNDGNEQPMATLVVVPIKPEPEAETMVKVTGFAAEIAREDPRERKYRFLCVACYEEIGGSGAVVFCAICKEPMSILDVDEWDTKRFRANDSMGRPFDETFRKVPVCPRKHNEAG